MAEIDSLEIKITSDAKSAKQAIDSLSQSLETLSKKLKFDTTSLENLGKINGNNFKKLGEGLRSFANAAKSLQNISGANFTKLANGIGKIASIDASKLEAIGKIDGNSFRGIGEGVKALSAGVQNLKGVKAKDFTPVAKGIEKLSSIQPGNIEVVGNALKPLADGINILSKAKFDNKNLQSLINSLTRLANANTGSLANIDFTTLGNSINGLAQTLSKAEEVKQNTISMTNAVAKLASAGNDANITAAALPQLGGKLKDFMSSMSGAGKVEEWVISFTQALGQLASAGKRTEATADGLPRLSEELKKVFDSMSNAPLISQNTIGFTQALGQLASAGGRAGISAGNLSGRLNVLSSTMHGIRGAAGNAVIGMKSFGRQLLSSMGIYLGIYGAIRGIKKAIDISSDLTEVQNVVDVTFGDMADKAEKFASTSIESLGMSELAAKQYASRFQAMGTAMKIGSSEIGKANEFLHNQTGEYVGLSDSMSDVSLNLTKLAADMASLYNVEQKDVAQDLEAIFTGQTRPLRTYGLDLTQATLAEWAMKQGLDADIRSMSQAEKTMLRYQYVLANTTAAHGDFVRTADTWANQIRVLGQNLQQLASVIGGVFINALKPLVKGLNSVIKSVTSFAKTVADALGTIFGWTIEISSGGLSGVADGFEDAAGAAGGMADGTGAAADNLKKMQKYIAPWHEVNSMDSPDASSGGGGGGNGGGGAGGGGGAADGAQTSLVKMETIFDRYKSSIDTLYKLGAYIGDTLSDAMESIDWDSIYEKARNFGKGLADFLNGLISPRLFQNVGETIAGSLNTALEALNSFGETFDWGNFGRSIAAGINGFFKKFNFRLLAKTLNTWAKGLLDSLIEAISKVKWEEIGRKIGQFLADLDFKGTVSRMAKLLWKAINAALKTYGSLFNAAPIETTLLTVFAALKFTKTGKLFASALYRSLSGSASGALAKFGAYFKGGLMGQIAVAVTAFAEFGIVFDSFKKIGEGVRSFGDEFLKLAGTITAAGAIMTKVIGFPAGLIATGIVGLIGAIGGFASGVEEAERQLAESEEMKRYGDTVANISEKIRDTTQATKDLITESENYVNSAGLAEADMAKDLADRYFELSEKQNLTNDELLEMQSLSGRLVEIYPELERFYNDQTRLLDTTREAVDKLIEKKLQEAKVNAYQEKITELYEQRIDQEEALADATQLAKDAKAEYNKLAINESEAQNLMDLAANYDLLGGKTSDSAEEAKELADRQKELGDELEKNGIELGTLDSMYGQINSRLEGTDPQLVELKKKWGELSKEQDVAQEALDETDETLGNLETGLTDATKAMIESQQQFEEIDWSARDAQQALTDMTNELSAIADGFEESFAKKMVLAGEGASKSVLDSFGKMKEGAKLESEELQAMFANIAPGLANSFSTALDGQEADTQFKVAQFVANIASGAEVSSAQAAEVFSLIGAELPQSALDSFAQADSATQQTIMNFFAHMSSGGQVAAENVKSLFSGFGYSIMNDGLLNSISRLRGEVQKKAIELVLELPNAVGEKKSEIAKELYKLTGITIEDGVIKPIEDGMADAADAAESGGENIGRSGGIGIGNGGRFTLSAANTLDKDVVSTFAKSKAPQTANKKGVEAGKQYSSGISGQSRNAANAATSVLNSSTGVFKGIGTTFGGFGSTAISSMASNIALSVGLVTVQMTAVMTALTAQFKNIGNQFSDIGKRISTSLSSGISSSANAISGSMNSLLQSMSRIASSFYDVGQSAGRRFAAGFQSIHIPTPHLNISSTNRQKFAGSTIALPSFNVRWYAAGGFPEDGWFRANHGEIMGKFDNGQSVVANNRQITDGISAAVQEGNRENNMLMRQEIALLRTQNELLSGILKKETGISYKDVFKAAKRGAREEFRRTGLNGLVF